MDLKALVRDIPNFPKPGIIFRDITTLLRDPDGLRYTVDAFQECFRAANLSPDYVVGIESRGFIFAPLLAYQLNAGFVPARKAGKLPAEVHSVEYALEYGTDKLEIHRDAIPAGSTAVVVDDLIATGGTAKATADLLAALGCTLQGFGFVIELKELNGRQALPEVPVITLLEY